MISLRKVISVETFEVKEVVLYFEDDEDVIFDRDERTILVLVLGPGLAPGLGPGPVLGPCLCPGPSLFSDQGSVQCPGIDLGIGPGLCPCLGLGPGLYPYLKCATDSRHTYTNIYSDTQT